MSYYDYLMSKKVSEIDPSFVALIMAAARKADTNNLERLGQAFPEIVSEFRSRYNAPGGVLEADG